MLTNSKIPNIFVHGPHPAVHGKRSIGCESTGSDVMLTFTDCTPYGGNNEPNGDREPDRILDVFLSLQTAQRLYDQLGVVLSRGVEKPARDKDCG